MKNSFKYLLYPFVAILFSFSSIQASHDGGSDTSGSGGVVKSRVKADIKIATGGIHPTTYPRELY